MKRRLLALLLAALLCLSLTACAEDDTYTIGICQYIQHDALDRATQGFKDVLIETFGEDKITFDEGNAAGDSATAVTICNGFVSSNVDLIMANATPCVQAAANATDKIPVLGTSVTEYGVALNLENFNGVTGLNVSGTSDLAPLDQQAAMVKEMVPDAEKVGIVYCSTEANSVYQANMVKGYLEDMGCTVTIYTFTDSNDVAAVTGTACSENDVLYIPTDNVAAACTEAINNVAEPAGVPIIAGEAGICSGCGVGTFSIDYYELGRITGEMAVKVLKGESDVSEMPIEYYPEPVKQYNAALASALGVTIPDGYEPLG